jgi:hypothetical protein
VALGVRVSRLSLPPEIVVPGQQAHDPASGRCCDGVLIRVAHDSEPAAWTPKPVDVCMLDMSCVLSLPHTL